MTNFHLFCIKWLCGLWAFSVSLPVLAQFRSQEEAEQLGLHFLQTQQKGGRLPGTADTEVRTQRMGHRAYSVRFGERFVLVAADEADPVVLGYGSGNLDAPLPPPLRAMLAGSRAEMSPYPPLGVRQWHPVEPLLTTVRHQKAPYNALCPYYLMDDGTLSAEPCVVGCVATALEQILTYYRRTVTLADTIHGWQTAHYTIADVLPGQSVDTRLIADNYDSIAYTPAQAEAVARLSYWLGAAVRMQWGPDESGAYTRNAVEPLRRVFGCPYVNYLDTYKYRPAELWTYLAEEVEAGRPVYYAGSLMSTGGHAFVLDGLDADGLFHVNWGYGDSSDGYFRLDVLCHTQPEADRFSDYVENGFFCNQEALTLAPYPVQASVPDSLFRTGLEVVVDSVRIPVQPMTGRLTQFDLYVRNTSDEPLTTSFGLLENAADDENLAEQAVWIALTGRTLQPGERQCLTVHAKLTRSGPLRLSLTPDGEQLLWSEAVQVADGAVQQFEVDAPELSFPGDNVLLARLRVANTTAGARAAETFIYGLHDDTDDTAALIYRRFYLPEGAELTDSAHFADLKPGHCYTLNIRQRWPVVQTVSFRMPGAAAVGAVEADGRDDEEAWYDLSGRRVAAPRGDGVYLRRRSDGVSKVLR